MIPSKALHARTVALFQAGRRRTQRFGEILKSRGLSVEIPRQTDRVHPSAATLVDDPGDIICNGHLLEMKGSRANFTGPHDFQWNPAMVDTVGSWSAKKVKPIAYVCMSIPTGAMMCLSTKRTQSRWTIKRCMDSQKGYEDSFYYCSLDLWEPLDRLFEFLAHTGAR